MSPDATMSAPDAAAALGVTVQTLYAYVSRGLVESLPGPGPSRARRYPSEAIHELVRRRETPVAERAGAEALNWGVPVLSSALTSIEGGRVFYRGYDAIELARTRTFDDVARLMWTGVWSDAPRFDALPSRRADGAPLSLMQRWLAGVKIHLASMSSPQPSRLRAASAAVCGLFAAVGAGGAGPLAERLARAWSTERVDAVNAALVLCADHELNVSAFTARCVASADARLEHVLMAALAAFQGRRHGGAGTRVTSLIDDAERDGVTRAIDRALSGGDGVPGFGHPLYPDGDPRATELLRVVPAGTRRGDVATRLAEMCATTLGLAPNLDFGLAVMARRLELRPDAGPIIFALGRSVGWIAHAFETWDDGALIRPRARYTGPAPLRAGDLPERG